MKRVLLSFLFSSLAFCASFSSEAWQMNRPAFEAMLKHPFNVELANGTLPQKKYQNYLTQDAIYLKEFSRTLAALASKLHTERDIRFVLEQAIGALNEQTKHVALSQANGATIGYMNFLQSRAERASRGEIAAAVLPCFWVYLEIAKTLKPSESSPFKKWFSIYSSESYENAVNQMIALTDRLAEQASPPVRAKMMRNFLDASQYELEFWEEVY